MIKFIKYVAYLIIIIITLTVISPIRVAYLVNATACYSYIAVQTAGNFLIQIGLKIRELND